MFIRRVRALVRGRARRVRSGVHEPFIRPEQLWKLRHGLCGADERGGVVRWRRLRLQLQSGVSRLRFDMRRQWLGRDVRVVVFRMLFTERDGDVHERHVQAHVQCGIR